jgi:hypothetical protein
MKKKNHTLMLKKEIDTAGTAMRKCSIATREYKTARKSLSALMADEVGEDRWVAGNVFQAIIAKEKMSTIDPIVFLKHVKSDSLRKQLLSVRIQDAKDVLQPAILKKILKTVPSLQPVLRIAKIGSTS